MGVLRAVKNAMPGFVHDYVDRREFMASVRSYHTTSYPIARKYAAFKEFHERCRGTYQADEPARLHAAAGRRFADDGYFVFDDPHARALAASLGAQILASGRMSEGSPRVYQGDLFLDFPRIEELFRGEFGNALRAVFGCHFKIFYGKAEHAVRAHQEPRGSELWHTDGGPGTCVNLMYCLSPVNSRNGAMELLPWRATMSVLERTHRAIRRSLASVPAEAERSEYRSVKCQAYSGEIERAWRSHVVQPGSETPGMLLGFRNNTLHKGGFPESGHERLVCIFHLYPSDGPTPFERYRAKGISKSLPVPGSPDF